jgi:hypothetical protein
MCSEALTVPGCSVTRCGHVFHTHCLLRWLEIKPLCPLCKASCRRGSTRELRAPAPLDAEEAARMRALAAADPSGAAAAAAAKKLRASAERKLHNISVYDEEVDKQRALVGARRAAVHKLEAEVLKLRRELASAERIEAAASAAEAVSAEAGSENEPPLPDVPPLPANAGIDPAKTVSRDAVLQQSKQLAWRCQEIRALEEKIRAASGDSADYAARGGLGSSTSGRGAASSRSSGGPAVPMPLTARASTPVRAASERTTVRHG